MDERGNDIPESDAATLIDNECIPSTDKESSKPSGNDDELTVKFVQTKTKPISYGTSDKTILNDQAKKDLLSRNFFYVEPLLFLMILAMVSVGVCNKALYLEKACRVYLNYSSEVCSNLTFYKTENNEAQKVSNNFALYSNLITLIPASIMTIFIGSWSDKFGRKKPILVAIFGMACQDILLLLNSQYMAWPLSYVLVAALPTGFTGSLISINTCIYSFASERTATKVRTFKYAILELAMAAALPTGTFVSGRMYQAWSYMPVYVLSLTAHAVAFLYTALTMKDTKTTDGHSFKELISGFFSLDSLKENVRTCMKLRANHGRAEIGLLFVSMCVVILGYSALGEIAFYFCEKMYAWSLPTYTDISTISIVVYIVVMVISIPVLTRKLQVPDTILGLLGSLSSLGQSLTRSFAYQEWIYYTSIAVGCFIGFGPLAVRSRLSKIVSADELGKVFAVLSSCESLVPAFGSLVFLQIYNASIESFPGLVYLCGAFFMVFPCVTFIVIIRWQRPKYHSMESGIDAAASTSVQ